MPTLKATKRENKGTRAARRLRAEGHVPAVLYGHGEATSELTLPTHEIELALLHGERVLDIEVDGNTENALIHDVQYDTFGQILLHVDLVRVNLNESVEVTVPVVLRGTPKGTDEGGMLQQITAEVTVECLVRNIPEDIRVYVNDLEIGDTLFVRDLEVEDGKIMDDPETPVASVTFISEEEVAEGEEEEGVSLAEPEVIGEVEAEEEGEGTPEGEE
ncbi:MAG: 50S ribosomal protein L25 [Planctomycetota bacterium]